MFDNYSTKGNYNPYTGKPGWIDPYSKISNFYYYNIPSIYRTNYNNLFNYLNNKDSSNYFNIVNNFNYQYKLFFTGLFKLNVNEIEDANQIFNVLRTYKGVDNFITQESTYWFEITSKYLDAATEFEDLYLSAERFEGEKNYSALIDKINNVKNPLNFYHKYLVKYSFEVHTYNYPEAIKALDSLIFYSSDTDLSDTLISNYTNLISYYNNKQNFLVTTANGTFYYRLETLYKNFYAYLIENKISINDLEKACFKLDKSQCSITDTILSRTITDTSKTDETKYNSLSFSTSTFENTKDTLFIISFNFTDSLSYSLYKLKLSSYKIQPLSKSIAYNYDNSKGIEIGSEYLIKDAFVAGLTKKIDNNSKLTSYRLYIYCLKYSNRLSDLSRLFK